jgi:transcriptional regulator with PAS, ATPase and Fis domain
VAVNCAGLPESLLESELFGHEKGAFTGAMAKKPGKFDLADGGTLLLDEISEMDPSLQAKLLRALQEGEIDPVGGKGPHKIDVRVIATTNRRLKAWVDEGRFRADLFYRLNVMPFYIPALRERRDDLDDLISFFVAKYNQQLRQKVVGFDDRVMGWFREYAWPGNVRELENLVAGAINMAGDDDLLTVDHLPYHSFLLRDKDREDAAARPEAATGASSRAPDPATNPASNPASGPAAAPARPGGRSGGSDAVREAEEIRIIKEQLVLANGRVNKAAERLGVSRQLLSYKMRKYGLSRHDYRPRLGAAAPNGLRG